MARPMRIWADNGLAPRLSSERLVDGGAKDARGNWDGRLSAYFRGYAPVVPHCVFCFRISGLTAWGRCAAVEHLALLHPDQSRLARTRHVLDARRHEACIPRGRHILRLCCYLVGLGRPSCTVHEGRRGVSGCSRIFVHNLIQQFNSPIVFPRSYTGVGACCVQCLDRL